MKIDGMYWCTRCGKRVDGDVSWCPLCHQLVRREIEDRGKIPVGFGRGIRYADVIRQFDDDPKEAKIRAVLLAVFLRMERSLHIKGSCRQGLDEMGPWQEIALRNWEEAS